MQPSLLLLFFFFNETAEQLTTNAVPPKEVCKEITQGVFAVVFRKSIMLFSDKKLNYRE